MRAAARVPLSNPARLSEFLRVSIAARNFLPFAPADRRRPGRSGSGGWGAKSAARAAPWAAFKSYRKSSHPLAGMLVTCAESVELVEVLPGTCLAGMPLVEEFGEVPACHEERRKCTSTSRYPCPAFLRSRANCGQTVAIGIT